ncbi:MAG: hypothetical protein ACLU7D_06705 [Collinsella sp.]
MRGTVGGGSSSASSCGWTLRARRVHLYLDVIDGEQAKHLTRKVTVEDRFSVEGLDVSGEARSGKPLELKARVSGDTDGLKYKFVWEKGGWARVGAPSAAWLQLRLLLRVDPLRSPESTTLYLDVARSKAWREGRPSTSPAR